MVGHRDHVAAWMLAGVLALAVPAQAEPVKGTKKGRDAGVPLTVQPAIKPDTAIAQPDLTPKDTTRPDDGQQGQVKISPAIKAAAKDMLPDFCRLDRNWSFEAGYSCWQAQGDAFAGQPVEGGTVRAERVRTEMNLRGDDSLAGGLGGDYWRDLAYPIGVRGQAWVGTYEAAGDGPTGTLTSLPFVLSGNYLSLLMGGGAGPDVYVALQVRRGDLAALATGGTPGFDGDAEDYVEVARIGNRVDSEELKRVWFDLDDVLHADATARAAVPVHARLVVVDQASGGWGHINVDDIRLEAGVPSVIQVREGPRAGLDFDPDFPAWGIADTHTHPANNLGFGGQTMLGNPLLPLDQAYSSQACRDVHMGADGLPKLGVLLGDPHVCEGAPDYIGFPRFMGLFYNGYQPDYVRRAWQGGQRLMVALGVNSQYLATRALGMGIAPGTVIDDHSQMLAQVEQIKAMVRDNSDFMEIAESPEQARRIILNGKMAVVLGIEIDNFGNFKDESYIWRDSDVNGSLPLETLSADPATASRQLADKIDVYWRAGIRQVTALHYADGLFGGVPAFQPEPYGINLGTTGRCFALTEGVEAGVTTHLIAMYDSFFEGIKARIIGGADRDALDVFSGQTLRNACKDNHPQWDAMTATVNAQRLTPRGELLFRGLMNKGMLVDAEHTSFATKDDIFALARDFRYPVMSSHTQTTKDSLQPQHVIGRGNPDYWQEADNNRRALLYGTTNAGFLANEFSTRPQDLAAIRQSGGTIGVFTTGPWRKLTYRGSWLATATSGRVRNNSAGSSKSWAQVFLSAAESMDGQGVGLASDRGGVEQVGPRFGVYAAWSLTKEGTDGLKIGLRDAERREQAMASSTTLDESRLLDRVADRAFDVRPGQVDGGVRYDRAKSDFHPLLFEYGEVAIVEEDMWKALAYIHAFPGIGPGLPGYDDLPDSGTVPSDQPQKVPASTEDFHGARIENFVRGWYAASPEALMKPALLDVGTGDAPWEQAAFYALSHNMSACDLPGYDEAAMYNCNFTARAWDSNGEVLGPVGRFYRRAKPVHDLWLAMEGNNVPLRRFVTGHRHWDFNLDGLANYGLMPDFLQDLRNVGINDRQMDVLFGSAEDYIEMWEKAEAASVNVPPLAP